MQSTVSSVFMPEIETLRAQYARAHEANMMYRTDRWRAAIALSYQIRTDDFSWLAEKRRYAPYLERRRIDNCMWEFQHHLRFNKIKVMKKFIAEVEQKLQRLNHQDLWDAFYGATAEDTGDSGATADVAVDDATAELTNSISDLIVKPE